MDYNAFSSGIEPGGLTDKNQIKILICYMLACTKEGLTGYHISEILANDGLVNYFESAQAVKELEQLGHITTSGELYMLTDSGKKISGELETSLPISVREKAINSALRAARIYQNAKDNRVTIRESAAGYEVFCEIYDRNRLLMSTVISIPDKLQAEVIKERFMKNPAFIYSSTLALYTAKKEEIVPAVKEAAKDLI